MIFLAFLTSLFLNFINLFKLLCFGHLSFFFLAMNFFFLELRTYIYFIQITNKTDFM